MTQYTMMDSPAPQRVRISWEMLTIPDHTSGPPNEQDEGFWPSLDPDAPGYIGEPEPSDVDGTGQQKRFDKQYVNAEKRLADWHNEIWGYVGVRARATLFIPCGGQSFAVYTLDSPGLWGIESDAGDYLQTVFDQEKAQLREHLAILSRALIVPDAFDEESES